MALNETQREIVYQAKYENGASFVPDLTKIAAKDDPMLVIGLGGTGVDALLRVKHKVIETFRSKNSETGVPSNVKFLAVDTDLSTFQDVSADAEYQRKERKHYCGVTVSDDEAFNIGTRSFMPFSHMEYISEWIDPELSFLDATAGAGGYRQVGRICLFREASQFVRKIRDIVIQLVDRYAAYGRKIQVYFLTGVSGGTGSGIFIDVAYLVRYAVEQVFGAGSWFADKAVFMSYIFTPDISSKNCGEDFIKINGYAALKELDYLMNLRVNGDRFTQRYTPEIKVDTQDPPYHVVHLISSKFIDDTPVEKCYGRAMQTAAEHIISLMISGYQSNVKHPIEDIEKKYEKDGRRETVGYNYCILGYSSRILPVKDIMMCLAHKLFEKVDSMMHNVDPTNEQINLSLSSAYTGLDLASIFASLKRNTTGYETLKTNPNLSKDKVLDRNSTVDVNALFRDTCVHNCAMVESNASAKYIEEVKERLYKALGKFFCNTAPSMSRDPDERNLPDEQREEFGPAWTNGLLVGPENGMNNYLCRILQVEIARVTKNIGEIESGLRVTNPQSIEPLKQQARESILHRGRLFEQYMNGYVAYYTAKQALVENQCYLTVLDNLLCYVYELNHRVFGTIESSLKAFGEVFERNFEFMHDRDTRRYFEDSTSLSWNLVDFDRVDEQISKTLENRDLTESANRLYAEIWENIGVWSGEGYDAFESLKKFIGNEFSVILSKGIEAYLANEYVTDNRGKATFEDYIDSVVSRNLERESEFIFNAAPAYHNYFKDMAPLRNVVLIPEGCTTKLMNAFNNGVAGIEVGKTVLQTKILWIKSQYGLPLYCYGDIIELEDMYEQAIAQHRFHGTHLYMNVAKRGHWKDLPAIVPASVRPELMPCASEITRREEYAKIFEEALKYGVIKYDAVEMCYILMLSGTFDARSEYEKCETTEEKLYLAEQVKNYLKPENDLPWKDNTLKSNEKIKLFKGYCDETEKDSTKEIVKKWFMICYDLAKKTEKENEKYRRLENFYTEYLLPVVNMVERQRQTVACIDDFSKIMITQTIYYSAPRYLYKLPNETIPGHLTTGLELRESSLPYQFALFVKLFIEKSLVGQELLDEIVSAANVSFESLELAGDEEYLASVGKFKDEVYADYKRLQYEMSPEMEEAKLFYEKLLDLLDSM